MKKINQVIIFCLLMCCFGCQTKSDKNKQNIIVESNAVQVKVDSLKRNPLLENYTEFLSQLDSADVNSTTIAVNKYIELFGQQSDVVCDSAFLEFDTFYSRLERVLNEKHNNDTTNYEALVFIEPGTQIPQKLINYRKNLQKNGFDINSEEGMTYIMQDRNFIAKHFYPYLSKTMKKYQVKLNIENAEGFVSDASIIISPQNIVERIIWYEKFIYEHPTFILTENCRTTLKTYQTILFTGIDNTPVFSFDSPNKLSDYYHEVYENLLSKYPGSKTANLIKPYYEAILNNNIKKSESIVSEYKKDKTIFNY